MRFGKLFVTVLILFGITVGGYYCFASPTTSNDKAKIESATNNTDSNIKKKDVPVIVAKPDYSIYGKGATFLEKYADNEKVKNIILVEQDKKSISHAKLNFLKKDNAGVWAIEFIVNAYLGKNGIDKQVEGDKKTPSGDYGFITAFGILDNPGTTIPYLKVNDKMYCCGDREYYNQIIDISKVNHTCTNASEHLISYKPQYNYGLFIDYNKEGVFGKGSAIFLHCHGSYDYTLGCISVSEDDMIKLLKSVDSNSRICIY